MIYFCELAYLNCNVLANVNARPKDDSFCGEQGNSSLHDLFGQFHRRNTVLQ